MKYKKCFLDDWLTGDFELEQHINSENSASCKERELLVMTRLAKTLCNEILKLQA